MQYHVENSLYQLFLLAIELQKQETKAMHAYTDALMSKLPIASDLQDAMVTISESLDKIDHMIFKRAKWQDFAVISHFHGMYGADALEECMKELQCSNEAAVESINHLLATDWKE